MSDKANELEPSLAGNGARAPDFFRGVKPLGNEDQEILFGRQKEIDDCLAMLNRPGFRAGVLLGDAGVGKTSFLLAGLAPALVKKDVLAVYLNSRGAIRQRLRRRLSADSGVEPQGVEDLARYASRIAKQYKGGLVLLLDDVSDRLADEPHEPGFGEAAPDDPDVFVTVVLELLKSGSSAVRMLFGIDSRELHRLTELEERAQLLTAGTGSGGGATGAPKAEFAPPLPPGVGKASADSDATRARRDRLVLDKFHGTQELNLHDLALLEEEAARFSRYRLESLDLQRATDVIAKGGLASGAYFDKGLPQVFAMDLTSDGPALPLHLQLAITMAIERRSLSARRFHRLGGATALRSEWLRARLAEAGDKIALPAMSALADRRAGGRGWVSPPDLARTIGQPADRLEGALASLRRSDLVEEVTEGPKTLVRLSQPALIPDIRDRDGRLRHRRVRAEGTLRRRLVAGGLLRPRELMRVRGMPLTSDEERGLVRRSRWVYLALCVLVLVGLGWLGVWIHRRAGAGYRLALSTSHGPATGTVVVRRGTPSFARFAWLPHSPRVGAELVDTGFGRTALVAGAAEKLRRNAPSGQLNARVGSWPQWFQQTLSLLDPAVRGEVLVLAGQPAAGWKLLRKAPVSAEALGRMLSLIRLISRGGAADRVVLEGAAKSPNAQTRTAAAQAALSVHERHPGSFGALLARLTADPSGLVRRVILNGLHRLGSPEGLPLARKLLAKGDRESTAAVIRWALDRIKKPGPRADLLSAGARLPAGDLRDRALQAMALLILRHPQAAAAGLTKRLGERTAPPKPPSTPAALAQLLRWLSALPGGVLAKQSLSSRLLELCQGPDPALRSAASQLAARLSPVKEVQRLLDGWAAKRGSTQVAWRLAAAQGFGVLLRRSRNIDLARLRLLARDPEARVRRAAVVALGHAGPREMITLMKLGLDPSVPVRAALVVAQASAGRAKPYQTVRTLGMMTQGGNSLLKAALVRAAAKLVTGKQFWPLAKMYILGPLTRGDSRSRSAAVAALGEIAHLRPSAALRALAGRARDRDRSVRLALARVMIRLAAKHPGAAAKTLELLARDNQPEIARAALVGLDRLATTKARRRALAAVLLERIRQSPDEVRRPALAMLGELPRKTWPTGSGKALVQAYGRTKATSCRQQLLRLARRHSLMEVAREAARAPGVADRVGGLNLLAKGGGKQDVKTVVSGLTHPAAPVRHAALEAMGQLASAHPKALIPLLRQLADSRTSPIANRALVLLGAVAESRPKVMQTLRRAARSPLVARRHAAARALGRGSKGLDDLLRALLRDPALEVRRSAVVAQARRWATSRSASGLSELLARQRASRQERLAAAVGLYLQRTNTTDKPRAQAAGDVLQKAHLSNRPLARLWAGAALLAPPPKGEAPQTLPVVTLLDRIVLF